MPSGHLINIPFFLGRRVYQNYPGDLLLKIHWLRSTLKGSDSLVWARDEQWFWKGSLSDADIYPRLRNIVSGFLEIHLRSNLKEENRRRGRNWWTITDSSHNKKPVKEERGHHLTALQMTPMVLKWTMGPHPITKAPIKFSAAHLAWQVHPEEEGLWMREARVKAQVGGGVGIYFHLNTPNTVPDSWKDTVTNSELCLSCPRF